MLILFFLAMLVSGVYQLKQISSSTTWMMQASLLKEHLAADWHGALVAGVQSTYGRCDE
ncbi:MAG: hypothetical protein ACR5LF_15720 [Symbiopectobacterium sp.]